MLFIFGARKYGKCDTVHGFGHVASQFFHLWYIPLIPLGKSQFIIEGSERFSSYRAVDIPLSLKSVLLAYMRGGLGFLMLLSAFGMVMAIAAVHVNYGLMAAAVLLLAGAVTGIVLTYKKFQPTENRQAELLRVLGMEPGQAAATARLSIFAKQNGMTFEEALAMARGQQSPPVPTVQ